MSDYNLLKDALWDVATAANLSHPTVPMIFSHQDNSELPETYGSINITMLPQKGRVATSTLLNLTSELDFRVAYEAVVTFNFYGSMSPQVAYDFNNNLNNNPLLAEQFHKHRLAFMRKGNLIRVPQKRDTQWVEGFSLVVTFSYITNTAQAVDPVEAVVIDAQLSGESETITVPPDFVIP